MSGVSGEEGKERPVGCGWVGVGEVVFRCRGDGVVGLGFG